MNILSFTKEELDELTNSFSDDELAERYGVTRLAILYHRKKWGIPSCREKNGWTRNRTDFGSYFDLIDSPAKAYFLGLLATDGSIDQPKSTMTLALHPQDQDILEVFIKELGGHLTIGKKKSARNPTPLCTVRVYRKHMIETLASWGIVQNKSLTLEILKPIPTHLERDFVRGVWDGDGTVGRDSFKFVSGSEIFRNQIREIILRHTGITLTSSIDRKTYILFGCRHSSNALKWMYQDAFPVMSRKAIRVSRFWGL